MSLLNLFININTPYTSHIEGFYYHFFPAVHLSLHYKHFRSISIHFLSTVIINIMTRQSYTGRKLTKLLQKIKQIQCQNKI